MYRQKLRRHITKAVLYGMIFAAIGLVFLALDTPTIQFMREVGASNALMVGGSVAIGIIVFLYMLFPLPRRFRRPELSDDDAEWPNEAISDRDRATHQSFVHSR